jgi:Protein of unknown function (DUF3095)
MADDFYETIPVLDDFADAVRSENYSPLPDDWVVGFADVVGSTKAVADGRYKAVNMVGAGAIAAVANALDRRPFPFVFGGDGASFAVSPSDAAAAARALQAVAAFARDEFHFELRVAMAPVSEIRAAGNDIRVARFAAAPPCVYAMFAGGGLTWFDAAAKGGAYALPKTGEGARPDLTGLSCRWGVAPAKHGLVLSLIVAPRGNDARFAPLINEIVKSSLAVPSSEQPVTLMSLRPGNPGRAIGLETKVKKASGLSPAKARLAAIRSYCIAIVLHTFQLKVGRFDAATYAAELVANADFRKFDDGLRMTLDCSPEFADALEARLAAADAFVHWGVFRQEAAQVTCFVPSATERGHVHFVDGAGGGYTMAAKAMKSRRDALATATAA